MDQKEKVAQADQGYNIEVTGRHVHVTEGMKQHALNQLSKLEHIGDRIIDVHVTMDIQRISHTCDITMKYGHTLIRSHAQTTDMYASIDQAVSKLESQLRKYKHRLKDHHAKKLIVEEVPVTVYTVEGLLEEQPCETHRIVASETQRLKTLSISDAIMKMELSQDPCLIFRKEDDNQLHVILRREDGNYGIVKVVA